MNTNQFIFRDKVYSCVIYVDTMEDGPYYIFVDLIDDALIDEFGNEVAIKTDFEIRLPKRDDYPALVELRQAIFNTVQTNVEVVAKKAKIAKRYSMPLVRAQQSSLS